jgi:hypothetical protein
MKATGKGGDLAEETCILEAAIDQEAPCPGPACSFWVDDFADGHCVLDTLESELFMRPGVAEHLLRLRSALRDEAASQPLAAAAPR